MSRGEHIDSILKTLPDDPGVYQYFNEEGIIIYVGKAKNLKNRVRSYFNKQVYENRKTEILVSQIVDIKYIIVESEYDALLLENSLIKKYQPRFNISLKDDKSYPWICIKKENFPRVFQTRNVIRDGSEYFGPYASERVMYTVLDLIKQMFPIRNCRLNLTQENIEKKKFTVCLEYHIGNCKAPCVGYQSEHSYDEMIAHIRNILKGNLNDVTKHLKELMSRFADTYQFEEAQEIKEKIEHIEKYRAKSSVVSAEINNVDVFSCEDDGNSFYINYLKVNSGSIVQVYTIELKRKLEETKEEMLLLGVIELRTKFESTSNEVILPFEIELTTEKIKQTIPQRGEKKQLLELSERNVKYFKLDKLKQIEIKDPQQHADRVMNQMMKDLRMKELPFHIECFDNSNFQGAFPVSAMVCFKNTKPSKADYRHFNVQSVEGPNDFDTMREVIRRRYSRVLEDNLPMPQLIIIDGGKGQLSVAVEELEKLGLIGRVTVIGIAKRLEEIYYPGDQLPLYIDKKSETLKLIQHLRNEAHRFGITHYRKRHRKDLVKTELQNIDGVGEATATDLLKHFKSVKKIKEATIEQLEEIIGKARAERVFVYFHS